MPNKTIADILDHIDELRFDLRHAAESRRNHPEHSQEWLRIAYGRLVEITADVHVMAHPDGQQHRCQE